MSQDTYHSKMSEFVSQIATNALVAVGSNEASRQGDVTETLCEAVKSLAQRGVVIRAESRFFSTPCFPAGAGPDFVNAAIAVSDVQDAAGFMTLLHEVESEFGRVRQNRWGQRTLDLDLIALGGTILPDPDTLQTWIDLPLSQQSKIAPDRLLLPHPRVQDRSFVLVPLMDIAPDWIHPLSGLSVRQMHDALPIEDRASVKPLDKRGNRA